MESRLNELTDDIFKKWQADQANLSSYVRELFGEGSLDEPAKLIQKLTEAAATPSTVAGAYLGGLTIGVAAGAAAGFAVAVVFRAIKAWGAVKRKEKESPFRYLTTLADNGVVFSLSQ